MKRIAVCLFVFIVCVFARCAGEELDMPDIDALVPATLVRVIDGDTAIFSVRGIVLSVRLIGVNAPESGRLYSGSAADYLYNRLVGQTAYLESDIEPLDDYGRSLFYVWLDDGALVNAEIIRDGAAAICIFPPNIKYVKALARAQSDALSENAGMWAAYAEYYNNLSAEITTQYIGNVNSRVLHLPNCAGLPQERNRIYFDSYELAIISGFRECNSCFK